MGWDMQAQNISENMNFILCILKNWKSQNNFCKCKRDQNTWIRFLLRAVKSSHVTRSGRLWFPERVSFKHPLQLESWIWLGYFWFYIPSLVFWTCSQHSSLIYGIFHSIKYSEKITVTFTTECISKPSIATG